MAYADAVSVSELLECAAEQMAAVEASIAVGGADALSEFVATGTMLSPFQGKNLEVELYNPRTNGCSTVRFAARSAGRAKMFISATFEGETDFADVENTPTLDAMLGEFLGPWVEIDNTVQPLVVAQPEEEATTSEE